MTGEMSQHDADHVALSVLVYERQGYPAQVGEEFHHSQTRRACRLARNIVAYVTAAHRLWDKAKTKGEQTQ